jgi:hypothetical protein
MKFSIITIAWIYLILPTLLVGQISLTWQDIAGQPGYDVVKRGGGDTLYATNGRGILNWSIDGGAQWSEILAFPSSTPLTNVAVNRNHVVVSLTYSSSHPPYFVWVWNNSPNVWTRIFLDYYDFSNIVVDTAGVVFGIAYQGIERYDGNGWNYVIGQNLPFPTNSSSGQIKNAVVIDDDDNFIVGADSSNSFGDPGLYISTDTGKTWSQAIANYSVTAVFGSLKNGIIAASSPNPNVNLSGGVFLSVDSGQTWIGLGLENKQITSVLQDAQDKIFALANGNVFKFIDSTVSWEMETNSVQAFQSLVALSPATIMASSEAAGMVRSVDEGAVWGGGEIRGKDIFAITETDSGDIVCGTLGSGIYRSVFGGTSWVASAGTSPCDYIYSFTKANGQLYAGSDCGILGSTDQGLNWEKRSDSLFPGSAYTLAGLPDGTLLAGTNFGMYRSSDGGTNWHSSGLASSKVYFMDISANNNIVVGTATDGVFLSSDGGINWINKGVIRDDIQTVFNTSSGKIFVGVYGGIYSSSDMGTTWQYRYFDDSYVYTLENAGTGLVYAGTYHGVFSSPDDGGTWHPTSDSGLAQQFVLSLFSSRQGYSLAGTYRGGIYRSMQRSSVAFPDFVSSDRTLPNKFSLGQNYPNPFNPATDITYSLPKHVFVQLDVYDILGRRVASLVNQPQPAGSYHVVWNASDRASGIYVCILRAGLYRETKKMLLLR